MNNDASIIPLIAELERAYDAAIPLFPEERLQKLLTKQRPIIVVQQGRSRGKKLFGWHAANRWERKGRKTQLAEITLTADQLVEGFYQAIDTLIHEMVHHSFELEGVEDVGKSGYHTKRFAKRAEEVGLKVRRSKGGSWNLTDVTPELKQVIDSWGLNKKVFDLFRHREKVEKKGSKLKRWACDCGYGIRIAADPSKVDLTCNICGGQVQPEE